MRREHYLSMLAENCNLVTALIEPSVEALGQELDIPAQLKPAIRELARGILVEVVKECFDKHVESDKHIELLAKLYSGKVVDEHDEALEAMRGKAANILGAMKLTAMTLYKLKEAEQLTEEEQALADMRPEEMPQA